MGFPNPFGAVTNSLINSVVKKLLSSLTKGLIAVACAALLAVAGLDVSAVLSAAGLDPNNQIIATVWGAIVALLHAAISGLKRAKDFDFSKVPK